MALQQGMIPIASLLLIVVKIYLGQVNIMFTYFSDFIYQLLFLISAVAKSRKKLDSHNCSQSQPFLKKN